MRLLASDDFSIVDAVEHSVGDYDDATDDGTTTTARSRARLASPSGAGQHSDFDLVVEVYPVSSEADCKRLYLEVNKAESVKEIDLPDQLAPELKAHIDGACELLHKRFPSMHKPSERCRPPHLHRDTLRNKLFQAGAARGAESPEQLLAMIMRVNEALKARLTSSWPERLRGKGKALEKAKAQGLFLGLDNYAWLDLLGE